MRKDVDLRDPATRRALMKALRALGFRRWDRSDAYGLVQYELVDRDTKYNVQIWSDGRSRVSFMLAGWENVRPVDFRTLDEWPDAFARCVRECRTERRRRLETTGRIAP